MNFKPLDQLAKVIENAFSGVTKVRKNFKTFFIEAMILFIAIPKVSGDYLPIGIVLE